MDIIRQEDDTRLYYDLNLGQVFVYVDDVYIKCDVGAIRLSTGKLEGDFPLDNPEVRVVKAKLYIQ